MNILLLKTLQQASTRQESEAHEMQVKFFKSSNEFREWLEENHNKASEIWVGYYKKNSGKTGITWQDSIDQALCYGWIDSTVRRLDELRYANRFTPRRSSSAWSQTNGKRFKELQTLGLVKPSGLRAFTQVERDENKDAQGKRSGNRI